MSNMNVGGTLGVTGTSTLSGNTTIGSGQSAGSLTVNGSTTTTGVSTLTGGLIVPPSATTTVGSTTIKGSLNTSGNVYIGSPSVQSVLDFRRQNVLGSNLTVTGDTEFGTLGTTTGKYDYHNIPSNRVIINGGVQINAHADNNYNGLVIQINKTGDSHSFGVGNNKVNNRPFSKIIGDLQLSSGHVPDDNKWNGGNNPDYIYDMDTSLTMYCKDCSSSGGSANISISATNMWRLSQFANKYLNNNGDKSRIF
jgi:hypothetical protein